MTSRFLTLEGVSLSLPDGRVVFSNLNETFDARPTGLVGRNGVGKTLLAQVLAGRLAPSAGRCLRSGPVHYLAQQVMPAAGARVADLAGAAPVLAALARIEAGGCAAEDLIASVSAGTWPSVCSGRWRALVLGTSTLPLPLLASVAAKRCVSASPAPCCQTPIS